MQFFLTNSQYHKIERKYPMLATTQACTIFLKQYFLCLHTTYKKGNATHNTTHTTWALFCFAQLVVVK
jgi:hypothetical protein